MLAEEPVIHRSRRKQGKPMGPGAAHIPNKAERRLLTTLMRDSGQTEAEVRASLSNRRRLAAAAKSMSQPKDLAHQEKIGVRRLKRRIISMTGLAHHDPRVEKIVRDYSGRRPILYYGSHRFDTDTLESSCERVLGQPLR